MLKRKIEQSLNEWKNTANHKPLIIKGCRQCGKTYSVLDFAKKNYKHVVYLNFFENPDYASVFSGSLEIDNIVMMLSALLGSAAVFEAGETVLVLDEIQDCPEARTALKFFRMDGRYDVIGTGSLLGVKGYGKEPKSIPVGSETVIDMYPLDFEEFLWAKGYDEGFVDELFRHMREVKPLSDLQMQVMTELFRDYVSIGGMPEVVNCYIKNKNFSGTLSIQRQLLSDYQEDITKYAEGLDKAKVKAVYSHIATFLAKENKRFQVTKIGKNARNRDYIGCVEWLSDAGIVNVCYCMNYPELPLKGNYDPKRYKLYFKDTGLLIASLDEEAQEDLRANKNLNTYKGAIYENIVGDMLSKQGYQLYYYSSDKPSVEMDFFVRDADSLIPVEVKANDNATASLNNLLKEDKYPDIRHGIKFCFKNIGFNGSFYTFPYFMAFLLKRFLMQTI